MTFYYGEALPVLGRRMIPARVKARKKEKKEKGSLKKKKINCKDGVFCLLSLCHLSYTHMQVTCFIFLLNLTVKLTLGCKM